MHTYDRSIRRIHILLAWQRICTTILKRSFPVLLTGDFPDEIWSAICHLRIDLLFITLAMDQYDYSTLEHHFSLPILPKDILHPFN